MKPIPVKDLFIYKRDISLMSDTQACQIAAVAKALSDPIRIQMIYLLSRHPVLCTCEFEKILSLAQSKVSYHLKTLLQAGLIEREYQGSWSQYKLLDREVLKKLQSMNVQGMEE